MLSTPSPQNEIFYLDNAKYQVQKFLGSGLTAKVYLGSKLTPVINDELNFVAIKNIKPEYWEAFQEEVTALYTLQGHPNIIKMIGYKPSKQKSDGNLIYLEYCESDLFDVVEAYSGFDEKTCAQLVNQQIIPALGYMHGLGLCHRDLKLDNLLMTKGYQIKIADFTFSTKMRDHNGNFLQLTKKCGTRQYMAPEVQQGKPYRGDYADIFSLGVIIFMMHMGQTPFPGTFFYKQLWRKTNVFWKQFTKRPTKEFKHLIQGMLCCDPAKRFTLDQIQNHPWIKQFTKPSVDSNQEDQQKGENNPQSRFDFTTFNY